MLDINNLSGSGIITKIIHKDSGNYIVLAKTASEPYSEIKLMFKSNIGFEIQDTVFYVGKEEISKFGKQINCRFIRHKVEINQEQIAKFLYENIKGIGEKTVEKLLEKFGTNLSDILLNNPELLLAYGIGEKKASMITKFWQAEQQKMSIIDNLVLMGCDSALALRIYNVFGKDSLQKFMDNPYELIGNEISFYDIDRLAIKIGIDDHAQIRIKATILMIIEKSEAKLNHAISNKKLFLNLLNNEIHSIPLVLSIIDEMVNQGLLAVYRFNDQDYYYKYDIYLKEDHVAKAIKSNSNFAVKSSEILKNEINNNKYLTEEQKNIITESLNHPISIINGPLLSGKRTLIRNLCYLFKKYGLSHVELSMDQVHNLNDQQVDFVVIRDGENIALESFYNLITVLAKAPTQVFIFGDHYELNTSFFQTLFKVLPTYYLKIDKLKKEDQQKGKVLKEFIEKALLHASETIKLLTYPTIDEIKSKACGLVLEGETLILLNNDYALDLELNRMCQQLNQGNLIKNYKLNDVVLNTTTGKVGKIIALDDNMAVISSNDNHKEEVRDFNVLKLAYIKGLEVLGSNSSFSNTFVLISKSDKLSKSHIYKVLKHSNGIITFISCEGVLNEIISKVDRRYTVNFIPDRVKEE